MDNLLLSIKKRHPFRMPLHIAAVNSPFRFLPHPEILPRMLVHQNVPLLCCGNMGVDFRDVDRTVPQHFLDVADIHIGF